VPKEKKKMASIVQQFAPPPSPAVNTNTNDEEEDNEDECMVKKKRGKAKNWIPLDFDLFKNLPDPKDCEDEHQNDEDQDDDDDEDQDEDDDGVIRKLTIEELQIMFGKGGGGGCILGRKQSGVYNFKCQDHTKGCTMLVRAKNVSGGAFGKVAWSLEMFCENIEEHMVCICAILYILAFQCCMNIPLSL
jgi:hypothetical protein